MKTVADATSLSQLVDRLEALRPDTPPAAVDPKNAGTKPGEFEADRRRAIDGLRMFAAAR